MTGVRAAIRVPISPTPNYLNRCVLLLRSLQAADPAANRCAVELFVSPDTAPAPGSWVQTVAEFGMRWYDVDQQAFDTYGYAAATHERFRTATDAEVILQADADMVVSGPIIEIIERSHIGQTVLGVTAYRSPFNARTFPPATSCSMKECWNDFFGKLGLAAPDFTSRHPAGFEQKWEVETSHCPVYFNYGVVAVPAEAASRLAAVLPQEQQRVDEIFFGAHRAQLALSAAICRLGLQAEELPLRFNFPNQPKYLEPYPEEACDIRILHYMNQSNFDKEADLDDLGSIERWISSTDDRDPLHNQLAEIIEHELPVLRDCPWNEVR